MEITQTLFEDVLLFKNKIFEDEEVFFQSILIRIKINFFQKKLNFVKTI